jgi:hypothetical protein
MYIDTVRRLRDSVRRKRPEKWTPEMVSPSRQCSSTPVGFGQAIISKEQCDNIAASPDLAPADFYIFTSTEFSTEGTAFCDATDTIKNSTKELKRFSQHDFQECSQQLYSH